MRYIIVSWVCGIVYWILDGVINWNPYAIKLFEIYRNNIKTSFSIQKSLFVYLIYGFAMAGIFKVLYKSLPGKNGVMKGVSFALIAWFFRGFIAVMSQWLLYSIPFNTLGYVAISGLVEALLLGMLLGLTLKG